MAPLIPSVRSGKRRVLVIDDDTFHSKAVAHALTATGRYEVKTLNDPRQALATTHEFAPELILLDVMMPEKDGGAVAAELREDPQARHVPIVFLTAAIDPSELEAQGALIGGYPFVAKPVSGAELLKVVERFLP